jgi:uncharacterized membrane protein YbhN (UPF0104 family)
MFLLLVFTTILLFFVFEAEEEDFLLLLLRHLLLLLLNRLSISRCYTVRTTRRRAAQAWKRTRLPCAPTLERRIQQT